MDLAKPRMDFGLSTNNLEPMLAFWQGEANRRAERLGAPAAWQLLSEPTVTARLWRLDPSGELAQDLARLIAEAVARASDARLVRSCRPVGVAVERHG